MTHPGNESETRTIRVIPCKDVTGRDRELQVIGEPGGFSLVTPPGDLAHFRPTQYHALSQAIRDVLPTAFTEAPPS